MGVAEGGIMPISQSLIAAEVDLRHRGLAMGVAQGLGSSLLGSFVALAMLVAFAEAFAAACVFSWPARRITIANMQRHHDPRCAGQEK